METISPQSKHYWVRFPKSLVEISQADTDVARDEEGGRW
jgi:hypothetical protein